ncbi:BrxA family protein [Cyanobium sp. NS01]|uniref:BrxA family protein n=1 Tax=Cyanobium sp. NS01 TaxID=261284 RepID=UPI00164412E0|nr:BrxA family protein [Cyanobium sp. NS01]
MTLASAASRSSRYCLSFTAASLRPELAAVIAGIHKEQGDWKRTKAAVLERNALQARSASTAKRLESELRQRLQTLTPAQLELLATGSSDDRTAMAWLAALKRIQLAFDVVQNVLAEKLAGMDPVLRRSDMVAFYEMQERIHPELAKVSPTSEQKIRSTLLHMLRDAGLLAGKAGKGSSLGTVQRALLNPEALQRVSEDDPLWLKGFLVEAPNRAGASGTRRTANRRAAP